MKIAILTAGGAGMFCGSCMHDNTLAKGLIAGGHECLLVPCYTPIRVDEADASESRVFLGGLTLYLDHRFPMFRRAPRFVRSLLGRPSVLRQLSRFSSRSDARQLGEMAVEMLCGEDGPLGGEFPPLVSFLVDEFQPDVILFSNALMGGIVPSLRRRFAGPIACLLQGDDVFLDALSKRHRAAVVSMIADDPLRFDLYLTHTEFYADYIADYLGLTRSDFAVTPLGIDTTSFPAGPHRQDGRTVGYFARLAPEKGLHHLVDAYLKIADRGVALRLGGFLHGKDERFVERIFSRLEGTDWRYVGSPETHEEKVRFYHDIDVFSVPADFLEPKGLPVLEAIGCGRPVVQPDHGAYSELIASTGGVLVPPADPDRLAEALLDLIDNPGRRLEIATAARPRLIARHDVRSTAAQTADVLTSLIAGHQMDHLGAVDPRHRTAAF